MAVVNQHDIYLDKDHDIIKSGTGDISVSNSFNGLKNIVKFRVQTSIEDWISGGDFVADIDRFIGQPNNEDTAQRMQRRVELCLLRDGLINSSDLRVEIVPVSPTEVVMFVLISNINTDDNSGGYMELQFKIDFTSGYIVGII